jgi:class 3 adenylate cyclase
MANLKMLFGDIYDSVDKHSAKVIKSKSISMETRDSAEISESFNSLPVGPQEELLLQTQIRPLFGKEGVNNTPIGTHPDFIDLEGTDNGTEKHYVCTLFVDIKGSTRLSLLYPLETIFKFKNAVIKTCVETVRSFDGHVHRLMGDAVMAFFGGHNIDKENAIADAINCSITLRAILEGSIKPWMEKEGIDSKDFGFRVGCDFGDDHEVLWGSFGYKNVGEVSATGLPVDMASKLQGLANKNQTMLGQGILEYINWPEEYSIVKEKDKSGITTSFPIVTPNLTDSDGSPLNYKMRLLNYKKSLGFSALPRFFRQEIIGSNVMDNLSITYSCYAVISGNKEKYISASKFLDKSLSIEFELKANTRTRLLFPLKVFFTKTNHGKDAPQEERGIEQPAVVHGIGKSRLNKYDLTPAPFSSTILKEGTSYRGLHTMKCEVFDNNRILLFRDWIGILIK